MSSRTLPTVDERTYTRDHAQWSGYKAAQAAQQASNPFMRETYHAKLRHPTAVNFWGLKYVRPPPPGGMEHHSVGFDRLNTSAPKLRPQDALRPIEIKPQFH